MSNLNSTPDPETVKLTPLELDVLRLLVQKQMPRTFYRLLNDEAKAALCHLRRLNLIVSDGQTVYYRHVALGVIFEHNKRALLESEGK